uniref:Uncharacterized protein n=1 Tax=Oryza nivara TaxID=4536 RepID=A0A0E0I510_ORYNI
MVGYANVGDAPPLRTQAMRSQEGQSHGTPPPQGTPWFANASACGLPHRLTTRATGGGGAARRGEASSSSRRCRLGGGAGEADAAREREPSMPFPNGLTSRKEWVSSFRLSISIQKRRYKLQCTRDSYNSQVLCELGNSTPH